MSEREDTIVPGTILADRYEVHEPIGHGGFGTVYRARQLNIDRDVAVKVLPQKFLTSTEVVERFRREAQLASRLRHPNTITIHDYGRHDDYLFIAMEYLQGEDLADVLHRERTLSVARIVHIATQALKSLSEAHDHGIVHRDLKPENIFLSVLGKERDFIKVLDFGIAKFAIAPTPEPVEFSESPENPFRKERQLTMSGSTVGTPIYMSPEQAAGEDVDALTDIYGLGIIMYEMASGRPPFYGDNPVKIMRRHLFEDVAQFKDPSLRNSPIERIILKALEKDKEKRFQNAGEFLAALTLEIDLSSPNLSNYTSARNHFSHHSNEQHDYEPPTLEMFAGTDDSEPFFNSASDSHAIALEFTPPAHDALRTTDPDLKFTNELDSVPFIQTLDKAREAVRQYARPDNSVSSILTVLDSPMHDTGEIFLLTRPKRIVKKTTATPASNPVFNATSAPTDILAQTSTEYDATGTFQRLNSNQAPPPPDIKPPPAALLTSKPITSPHQQQEPLPNAPAQAWNWNDLPTTPTTTELATAKSKRSRNLLIVTAIVLMATAVLIAAYLLVLQ